jgi:hypothetical protein
MKIYDITPLEYRCLVGACPAVFRTDRASLLIVGRLLTDDEKRALAELSVGDGETVIEVPTGLLAKTSNEQLIDD